MRANVRIMTEARNMTSPDHWKGYWAAVVTPFNDQLVVDEAAFIEILRWLTRQGMHGLTVAGTTGEWPSLTQEERIRLFSLARSYWPAHLPLVAGCSALRIPETITYIDAAAERSFDAVLVTIPPYLNPSEPEVLNFYQRVASVSKLPLIAYNWPSGTGRDLSPTLLADIARIPGVAGVKNSTADRDAFRQALRQLAGTTSLFGIMPGELGLELLETVGGNGCIGASGALGRYQPGFFEAFWNGDRESALRQGRVDQEFMSRFFQGFEGRYGHAISTIKALLNLQGVPAGKVRPPLLDLGPEGYTKLKEFAEEYGLYKNNA